MSVDTTELAALAAEMRAHGVSVVSRDPTTGHIMHCELGTLPTTPAEETQHTDEDLKRKREEAMRQHRRISLAATGGPVPRGDR